MTTFHVIDGLTVSEKGPIAKKNLIHLRQGDIGGACGPYCLMMCLMLTGAIDRDEAMSPEALDGRTRVGKLWSNLKGNSSYFHEGTSLRHLQELLSVFRHLEIECSDGSGTDIRKFVHAHLKEDHPVILGINGEQNMAHWIVAVGWEDTNGDGMPDRILVLDPEEEAPKVACWNAVLDLGSIYGRYPYAYWADDDFRKVALDRALAIW